MSKISNYVKHISYNKDRIMFVTAITGLVFYEVGPIFFPHADLRRTELIPIYTLMLGGSAVAKDKKRKKQEDDDNDAS